VEDGRQLVGIAGPDIDVALLEGPLERAPGAAHLDGGVAVSRVEIAVVALKAVLRALWLAAHGLRLPTGAGDAHAVEKLPLRRADLPFTVDDRVAGQIGVAQDLAASRRARRGDLHRRRRDRNAGRRLRLLYGGRGRAFNRDRHPVAEQLAQPGDQRRRFSAAGLNRDRDPHVSLSPRASTPPGAPEPVTGRPQTKRPRPPEKTGHSRKMLRRNAPA